MALVVAAGVDQDLLERVNADVVSVGDDLEKIYRLEQEPDEVDVFILGRRVPDPVETARRVGNRYTRAGILILVVPEREDAVRQAVRFAPLISKHVRTCSADRPDEIVERIEKMVAEADQRRRYGAFLDSVRETMPRYEQGQLRTELFLDILLEHVPIGILLIDDDHRILDINAEAVRLTGVSVTRSKGTSLDAVFMEENRAVIEQLLERTRANPRYPQSVLIGHGTDASQRDVEVTAARPAEPGRMVGALLMLHDVTDRLAAQRAEAELQKQRAVAGALEKQADELQRLNDELERSNLELQEFAYIASHDLQEPLRKIVSFADLLIRDHAPQMDENARFLAERLQSASLRMSELIRGLLNFARVRTREFDFDAVDLNEVIEDVSSDLEIAIQETDARIEWENLPRIEADKSEMMRLFQNLIRNSLTYRREDVKPRVRITAKPVSANETEQRYRIAVSDNGIGFDNRFAEKIFLPYQRLHSSSEQAGTGLGLAICRRIVNRHGGTITAEGHLGQGSTFTIELPARQQ